MAETDYISLRRLRRYTDKIKELIAGAGNVSVQDMPLLEKLLVTVNPDQPDEEQYLVPRDVYAAPANPTFSPVSGGSGNGSLTVTFSCTTSGATIQYRVNNGSWVTGTSVTLQQDTSVQSKAYTIEAKAVKDGLESSVVSASYTVYRKVATPTFASATGDKYSAERTITFACATSGATIQYKIGNGEWQTGNSVTLTASSTITLRATLTDWVTSSETSKSYTLNAKKCYIGRTTGTTVSSLSSLLDSKAISADTLVGEEETNTFTAAGRIWFIVPSGVIITKVSSGGYIVPIELVANQISGYNCYRRVEDDLAGTYTYTFE